MAYIKKAPCCTPSLSSPLLSSLLFSSKLSSSFPNNPSTKLESVLGWQAAADRQGRDGAQHGESERERERGRESVHQGASHPHSSPLKRRPARQYTHSIYNQLDQGWRPWVYPTFFMPTAKQNVTSLPKLTRASRSDIYNLLLPPKCPQSSCCCYCYFNSLSSFN